MEQVEAGVEGEGGGEDEGGEGDAVGHQDEGEEPPSAWTHSTKLISFVSNYSCICKYSWISNGYHAAIIL